MDVYAYVQTFGDTSLGRGGLAGQSLTSCLTVAVVCGRAAAVYRAGRLDYLVAVDQAFVEKLRHGALPGRSGVGASGLTAVGVGE